MGTVKTTTNSDGSTTTSKLRFSYDADGKVVAVNYNGHYYYYLRHAQNDIVKLIDKTGATVVEYAHLNSDLAAVEVGFLGQTAVNLGLTRVHTRKE